MKKYEKISGFADEIAEDVDTQFRILKKLNIQYFEPRGIDGKNIADLSDDELFKLKAKMKDYGIRVSSIGSTIGKIRLEEDFQSHFQKFQRVVEIAKKLNARYIRMFSFYHVAKKDQTIESKKVDASDIESLKKWTSKERMEVLRRLRQMIVYAKEQGVVLLHENEKGIYGDTVEHCEDLMRELGCEYFQMVFDPANFVQCGQDTKEAYEKLKDFIGYLHIKDALFEDGKVVPVGDGDGNV